ncbi:MAG TPA: hypothetical protein VN087_13170 [Verrucomicrobiae bacterium]|jgi:hypothetical protein|nr:hypothetical protein [Verrucomicrobiae bacterium]
MQRTRDLQDKRLPIEYSGGEVAESRVLELASVVSMKVVAVSFTTQLRRIIQIA